MTTIPEAKWSDDSQFIPVGSLNGSDQIMGLRSGMNVKGNISSLINTVNGKISGPVSSTVGNIPTFSNTAGNVVIDSGVNISSISPSGPSNNLYWAPTEFIQNGMATDGSSVVTGLGSTIRMYVGMTVLGSTFPIVTIVSIDSDTQITLSDNSRYTGEVSLYFQTDREGNDTTGNGQITSPFATYEKARQRAVELEAGLGNSFNLIFLGSVCSLGTFNLTPWVNIDFNGAYFSMDSILTVGGWEDGNSNIVIQNGQLSSTWNLDTSALGTLQKEILWRNIFAQNGGIDVIFKGNGSEYFCIANDTATDAFTFYVNKIDIENFNFQTEAWIATNSDGITVKNTSDLVGINVFFAKNIYSNVNIVTTGTQQNALQSTACTIAGTITIDGSHAVWQPDPVSNKQAILLNDGSIDDSVIQQTLWPKLSAYFVGPFTPGPGGGAVVSGVKQLDTFNSFTDNSGYSIPQTGQYRISYMANTSATDYGDYNIDLCLTINSSVYTQSIVTEQIQFNSGDSIKKSPSGSIIINLNNNDYVSLFAKNNGGIDIDINTACLSIERIY